MSQTAPTSLAEAFFFFCQGNFSFRLPRTMARDEADTQAFFFNSVADELERIIVGSREQEQRLAVMTSKLSDVLIKVAGGDFDVQAERDERGDSMDVLVFLVNNTISELKSLVEERNRASDSTRAQLEQLVAERTAQLQQSEDNFRQLFDASPVAMILSSAVDNAVLRTNAQAGRLFQTEPENIRIEDIWTDMGARRAMLEKVAAEGYVDGFVTQLQRRGGDTFWADLAVRLVTVDGERCVLSGTRDISEQKLLEARLRELATTDELTGALNRRRLFEVGEQLREHAVRYSRPFALAMLDLDRFKTINDTWGHGVGDKALRLVSDVIRKELRTTDSLGRYGGEELVVLFSETTLEEAQLATERIRSAVGRAMLWHDEKRVPLSISGGVVSWRDGELLEELVKRADDALYQAKAGGRNKVVPA
ncbi:MAG: diguanylate cyclase [Archangium sp.]